LDEGKKIRFLDEGKKIKSWQLLEFVLRGLQFQAKTLEALKGLEFKGKIRLNKWSIDNNGVKPRHTIKHHPKIAINFKGFFSSLKYAFLGISI
jgi:hypothetical protein